MRQTDNPSIINRAGMLPYYIDDDNEIRMLFMIPTPNDWIEAVAQISKGRIEPNEMPLKCALREATEELGLKSSNLTRIDPIGQYSTIMFYLGNIGDPDDFDEFDKIETQDTVWLTPTEFFEVGRQLHAGVVQAAVDQIRRLQNEQKSQQWDY